MLSAVSETTSYLTAKSVNANHRRGPLHHAAGYRLSPYFPGQCA